jgi:hypothetical protein
MRSAAAWPNETAVLFWVSVLDLPDEWSDARSRATAPAAQLGVSLPLPVSNVLGLSAGCVRRRRRGQAGYARPAGWSLIAFVAFEPASFRPSPPSARANLNGAEFAALSCRGPKLNRHRRATVSLSN